MLAEQRRSRILEIVNAQGSISVNDLHRRLEVSRETIRRDVTRLDADGRLRKTHGGALALTQSEPVFEERLSVNADGKRAIGRAAAAMIADGASMLIDSGTTTICLAENLTERQNLLVYTNDVHIAAKLAGRNNNRVLLTGGEYLASEGAMLGRDATVMLSNYYPDYAFVGASAMSAHPWLMDYSREAAELRAQMLSQARTKVVLADHTKFDRTAPVRVPGFDQVDVIITDVPPSARMQRGFARIDAELVVAKG
jgi:DeoR family glycerol-3-phosphate regulon repressor